MDSWFGRERCESIVEDSWKSIGADGSLNAVAGKLKSTSLNLADWRRREFPNIPKELKRLQDELDRTDAVIGTSVEAEVGNNPSYVWRSILEVWDSFGLEVPVRPLGIHTCNQWFDWLIVNKSKEVVEYSLTVAWILWKERNLRDFKGKKRGTEEVVFELENQWQEWKKASDGGGLAAAVPASLRSRSYNESGSGGSGGERTEEEMELNPDLVLFTDGAWSPEEEASGLGFVLIDGRGKFVAGGQVTKLLIHWQNGLCMLM
ncbi:hypothetical protein RIF29_29275 [Crotalaria pallida]|uniref:Uncharacterized protein n=1 Tax=Crotalaria pallida TaxID=3830 RepID=A0AAN9I083_CROPI